QTGPAHPALSGRGNRRIRGRGFRAAAAGAQLMQVLIDAGNTRIKLGWTQRGTGQREDQVLALEHNNIQHVAAWLAALPESPRAAIGVNVAGQALAREIEYIFSFSQGLAIDWVDGGTT